MQTRPIPINQIKRDKKKLLESRSATSLIDDYVAEVYDCKTLSADDYCEIRSKHARDSRHKLLLVRVKR
jgi:recombinational DNA repair protein RecR